MSEEEHAVLHRLIEALGEQYVALEQRVSKHLMRDEAWQESVNAQLAVNTEITTQIRDIVTSFHTLASIAKWIAVFGSAVAAVVAAWRSLRGGL